MPIGAGTGFGPNPAAPALGGLYEPPQASYYIAPGTFTALALPATPVFYEDGSWIQRQPDRYGNLNLYRQLYQTVGQPFQAFRLPPPPRLEPEEYTPARQDPGALHRFRTKYQTVGQPFFLNWKSNVPDTTDSAWPQYDNNESLHRFRTGYQTVGQPYFLNWKSKIPDTTDPAWPQYDNNEGLHRFRTTYQTVGQPWQAFTRPTAPRLDSEEYAPQRSYPYPISAPVAQTAQQPWFIYGSRRPPDQVDEQPAQRGDALGIHRYRTGYQTVGQPYFLNWRSNVPDTTDPAWPQYDNNESLHRFRTTYQTVGQPWAAFTRPPAPRLDAEDYEARRSYQYPFWTTQTGGAVSNQPWWLYGSKRAPDQQDEAQQLRPDTSVIHRFRTGYQTVGQPFFLGWKSSVPDTTDGAWPQYDLNESLHRFRTTYQTVGQPWFLGWRSNVPDTTDSAWPQYDRNEDLHRFRTGYQTVGQPWQAFTRPPLPSIDPEDYTSQRQYPYPRVNYQTVGQPFFLGWKSNVPDIPDTTWPQYDLNESLHRFRTTYQTVGQPWFLGWKSNVPDTTDSAWPQYDRNQGIYRFRTTYQTVGQPLWLQGWKSNVPDTTDSAWPQYDPNRYFFQFQTARQITSGNTMVEGAAQPIFFEANDGFPRQPDRTGVQAMFYRQITPIVPSIQPLLRFPQGRNTQEYGDDFVRPQSGSPYFSIVRTKFRKAFPPYFVHYGPMEFTDWAKAMMIANSFTSTMGPADEESWQDWAANFVNLPRIETLSLPHPYLYSNWRDWAEGVAIAMTQSGF